MARTPRCTDWPPEAVQALLAARREGLSGSAIAARVQPLVPFRVTRHAALARLKRLKDGGVAVPAPAWRPRGGWSGPGKRALRQRNAEIVRRYAEAHPQDFIAVARRG